MGRLIILSGLPGVGKTAIAKKLAIRLGAIHLRIDSIEQAIRNSGTTEPMDDRGYQVAYVVAEDNLRIGNTVIADCVNPIRVTRDAWIRVAERAGVTADEIEVVCSDPVCHRQRVEGRSTDIEGMRIPTWSEVVDRQYAPWHRKHIVIDTAGRPLTESVDELHRALTIDNPQ